MAHQLTHELETLIAAEVARGTYANADDFLAAMASTFADSSSREAIRTAWLNAAIELADQEGGELTSSEVFEPVLTRLRERANGNEQGA